MQIIKNLESKNEMFVGVRKVIGGFQNSFDIKLLIKD